VDLLLLHQAKHNVYITFEHSKLNLHEHETQQIFLHCNGGILNGTGFGSFHFKHCAFTVVAVMFLVESFRLQLFF